MNTEIACRPQTLNPISDRTPSLSSLMVRQFNRLRKYLAQRRIQNINRDAFRHLLSLDDSMLKDIGLTKGDVMWASQLPKSQDAAVELEIVARRRGKQHVDS